MHYDIYPFNRRRRRRHPRGCLASNDPSGRLWSDPRSTVDMPGADAYYTLQILSLCILERTQLGTRIGVQIRENPTLSKALTNTMLNNSLCMVPV